jgi:hypothetical protein
MPPFSAIAIFCEDIREETSGTHTLVGVLPDNIVVGAVPGMLPKLGIYVRIRMDVDATPKTMTARMKIPGGQLFEIANFAKLIASAKEQAVSNEASFVGFIAKGTLTPLPIPEVGTIEAIVEVDGTDYVCGILKLIQRPDATAASTATLRPA